MTTKTRVWIAPFGAEVPEPGSAPGPGWQDIGELTDEELAALLD